MTKVIRIFAPSQLEKFAVQGEMWWVVPAHSLHHRTAEDCVLPSCQGNQRMVFNGPPLKKGFRQ